jgi:hypothetical protein
MFVERQNGLRNMGLISQPDQAMLAMWREEDAREARAEQALMESTMSSSISRAQFLQRLDQMMRASNAEMIGIIGKEAFERLMFPLSAEVAGEGTVPTTGDVPR